MSSELLIHKRELSEEKNKRKEELSEEKMLELNGVQNSSAVSNSNNPASSMLSMLNMNIHEARSHHHHHNHHHHSHPFQFLGSAAAAGMASSNASHAPLSALHSMTDLKNLTTTNPSSLGTNNHPPSPSFSPRNNSSPINHKSNTPNINTTSATAATAVATTVSASSPSSNSSGSSSVGTPHGIQDILSRPTSFGPGITPPSSGAVSAALGTALATGTLPRFSLAGAAAVAASQGMYFNAANSNLHKLAAGLGDLSTRHLYWPQMVQNQALWRERLSGSGKRNLRVSLLAKSSSFQT